MFRLTRSVFYTIPMTSALVLGALASAPAARADYVSQSVNLDQSNVLKDGVSYGSVLIEAFDGIGPGGGGLNKGEVRLTYSASIIPDYVSVSKTFGIQQVGFNTDLSLSAGQITGPAGWKLGNNKTLSGFGKFTWELSGTAKGGSRPNPVTVLITGLDADATKEHFLLGSVGNGKNPPAQGSVYFAMHVAGFEIQGDVDVTSHFVGGSGTEPPPPSGGGEVQPTPEPSTILICGISLGCMALNQSTSLRRRLTRWKKGPQ